MVRVFVNYADNYTGKAISKLLANSVVGGISTDDSDDVQDSEGASSQAPKSSDSSYYVIIGSLTSSEAIKPDWVTEVIENNKEEDLLAALISCDIIIYHVTGLSSQMQEASWAIECLHEKLGSFTSQKLFICVSSVLTWGRSKPLDPEEPDVPYTEEDYRRRRPHPNFKDQVALEKTVIKMGKADKSKLITYIVAAGLVYGQGESIFHFMFKEAWYGDISHLPVYGDGQNFVPTIHVSDLASVILNIADNRPKTRYILALDESHNTLQEIIKAISLGLGPGRIKNVLKEDALLNKEVAQSDYDQLMVNIQMEASSVKDMSIEWKAETGMVDNMSKIIKEYKEARGLLPIHVCILGPPAVGKSFIVTQLCQHYKLHHVKIADTIKEAIENHERTAARADLEDLDDDEMEEEDGKAQHAQEFLDLLKEDLEENDGRYSEQYIIEFYKKKLSSMPCQNQGYILDGFPKTYEQAKVLFAPEEDAEEDDETGEDGPLHYNRLIMPEIVISLDASDEFLKERVMNLPQAVVEGTHNNEKDFIRRLSLYRAHNQDDTTVLNYFDEYEFHPKHINVEEDESLNMKDTIDQMIKLIGKPRNYGPTQEEKAEIERVLQEEKTKKEALEKEIRDKTEQKENELRAQREAEWNSQKELVLKEEKEMLETRSMPLRNYLMQHVMPTLTEGLIEACKVKPEDPIDYLAEYLFKNNPQVD